MDDLKSDTAKIIQTILIGIGTIVIIAMVLGAIFGTPIYISSKNNDKVQQMTTNCIEKGYDGWTDFDGDSQANLAARSYCYNQRDEDN